MTDAAREESRLGARTARAGRRPIVAVWLASVVSLCPAVTAAPGEPDPNGAQPSSRPPDAGFWPTPRMIELVLLKGAKTITEEYGLDERQSGALKRDFLTRYPALLKRHRAALQPIANEILEMGLADETPTAERVAEMARTLEPVLKDVRKTLQGTYDAIKPLLDPEQRRRWEGDYLKIWAGFSMAEAQLIRWKRGQFKPSDWPPRFGLAYRRRPRSRSATSARADSTVDASAPGGKGYGISGPKSKSPDRFANKRTRPKPRAGRPGAGPAARRDVPLDQWQGYVKRFIKQHHLDNAQTNQAMAILKEVRQRAKEYKKQNRDLFQRIEKELPGADAARREKLNSDLAALRRPLRDLFDELCDRLDGVLRSSQR